MAYVYVLKSLKNGKRYVGNTTFDPRQRLSEHNWGTNQFTKGNKPFILVHQEEYKTITEARKRENFLKSGAGRKFLDDILK